jgi:hypothetical protein
MKICDVKFWETEGEWHLVLEPEDLCSLSITIPQDTQSAANAFRKLAEECASKN